MRDEVVTAIAVPISILLIIALISFGIWSTSTYTKKLENKHEIEIKELDHQQKMKVLNILKENGCLDPEDNYNNRCDQIRVWWN